MNNEQFTPEQAKLLREVAEIASQDPRALRWYVNAYRWGGGTLWLIKHGGPIVALVLILWSFGLDFIDWTVEKLRGPGK